MSAPLGAALIVLLFAVATLWADALPGRLHWIPLALLGGALGAGFMEVARYDHGQRALLFGVGWIGAPLVAIFGGAAWGTRRFYGWPDLGPHPSRAAAMAACILVGVLTGTKVQAEDIRISQQRAEALLRERGGTREREAGPIEAPRSRMGWFAPPPYRAGRDERNREILAFPLGQDAWRVLDAASGVWHTTAVDPFP